MAQRVRMRGCKAHQHEARDRRSRALFVFRPGIVACRPAISRPARAPGGRCGGDGSGFPGPTSLAPPQVRCAEVHSGAGCTGPTSVPPRGGHVRCQHAVQAAAPQRAVRPEGEQ